MKRFALTTALVLLAACAVGPDFQPPQTPVPPDWVGPRDASATQPAVPDRSLAAWWTLFSDPTLTSLIERAAAANLDVQLAQSRLLEARAARRAALSGFGPAANLSSSYRRSAAGNGPSANAYDAAFDASWEVDLFGRVRRTTEAATAEVNAALEDLHDAQLVLAAEVARNYIDLRNFQQRLLIARRNLQAQQHSADITRQRFDAGLASGLDVANADSLVATTTSQIPVLEQAVAQTIYAISLLLAQPPGGLLDELSTPADIPAAPAALELVVPSELLRRRPDIRRAENDIHAATARVGVATADLFPRLTLNGSVGFRTDDPSSWFTSSSRFWSLGPSATWEIFNTGRTRANIDAATERQRQSLILYRRAVLDALREVEDALVAVAREQQRRLFLIDVVAADRRAVDLATRLYTEGQTDFLNVLDAQRSLWLSESALADSTATVSTNLIALYKALGGGWDVFALSPLANSQTTTVDPPTEN